MRGSLSLPQAQTQLLPSLVSLTQHTLSHTPHQIHPCHALVLPLSHLSYMHRNHLCGHSQNSQAASALHSKQISTLSVLVLSSSTFSSCRSSSSITTHSPNGSRMSCNRRSKLRRYSKCSGTVPNRLLLESFSTSMQAVPLTQWLCISFSSDNSCPVPLQSSKQASRLTLSLQSRSKLFSQSLGQLPMLLSKP